MKPAQLDAPQIHDTPRIHDLLQIDPEGLISDVAEPSWVRQSLIDCPWVVVRRRQSSVGQAPDGLVPVGVRGAVRSQRWGAFCAQRQVHQIVGPENLCRFNQSLDEKTRTPALRAFQQICARWADLALPWGPAGSVGFELATGRRVTTDVSDVDLVIRAPRRISIQEARSLLDAVIGLDAKIDVRVETPVCGFSIEEYARASPVRILLRYIDGPQLGDDPWLPRG